KKRLTLGVVNHFSVFRLERIETAVLGNLHGLTPVGRHLPDLPLLASSRSIRPEIDPLAILRPARSHVACRAIGHALRPTAVSVCYVDLPIPVRNGVDCDPLAVRRPSRAAGVPYSRQLHRVGTVGITQPDLDL